MKIQIFYLVLVLLLNSCKEKSEDYVCDIIEPNANIKPLLDSFVNVNGQNNAEYGIYIDKTSPHTYDLIIYTGNEPLTNEEDNFNNQYPINKVKVSNIEFKVYSGIEHYFQNKFNGKSRNEIDSRKIIEREDYVIWVVKDSSGLLTTYKTPGAYPFIALPKRISDSLYFVLPGSAVDD